MHLDIHGALTKKIGPLPGAAWAGIALVGVVAYVHFHKGSTSSSAASTTDPGTTALDTSGGLLGGGGGGGGGVTGSDTVGASTGTLTDPTPVFVPVLDPSSTQFPDSGSTQPEPVITTATWPPPVAPSPTTPQTQTLNVSSGGQLLGTVQAPILPIGTPASELYAAVGLKASDPFTLTPPSEPQNATQLMEVAQAHEIQQAQATASKTHQAVAV